MKKLRQLLEFALPDWLRRHRPMPDTELVAALAHIDNSDPALRAIVELIYQEFQDEVTPLFSHKLGESSNVARGEASSVFLQVNNPGGGHSGHVEFQRGRAAALFSLLDRIEAARHEARELKRKEQQS